MLSPIAIGINPKKVVRVVNKTGLSLWAPVLIIASRTLSPFFLKLLYVSNTTILLLTTMPAKAITPIPLITIPNGLFVKINPIITPIVEKIIAVKIIKQ